MVSAGTLVSIYWCFIDVNLPVKFTCHGAALEVRTGMEKERGINFSKQRWIKRINEKYMDSLAINMAKQWARWRYKTTALPLPDQSCAE